MGAIKTGWDFFQDQILGMHWLKDLMQPILPSVLQEFCVWHTCFLGSGNLCQRGRNGR